MDAEQALIVKNTVLGKKLYYDLNGEDLGKVFQSEDFDIVTVVPDVFTDLNPKLILVFIDVDYKVINIRIPGFGLISELADPNEETQEMDIPFTELHFDSTSGIDILSLPD